MAKRSPKADTEMMPFMLDEGIEIDICPISKGLWFDAGELAVLTGLAADVPAIQHALQNAQQTQWRSPVAECNLMEIHFHYMFDVRIDYCPQSGGIWLDKGELDKLKSIAARIDNPTSRLLGAVKAVATEAKRRDRH